MDQNEREGYTPPTRSEELIAKTRTLAIYTAWALLTIGLIWLLFNLPPGVSRFLSAVLRIFSAFN